MPWLTWACAFSVAAVTAIWMPAGKFIMAGSPRALTGSGIAASTPGVSGTAGWLRIRRDDHRGALAGRGHDLGFHRSLGGGLLLRGSPAARAQVSDSAAINRIFMGGRCPRTARITKKNDAGVRRRRPLSLRP